MRQDSLANLIIGGVNKAGTTSLFTYLGLHPEIGASRIKETHYFLPAAFGKPLPPVSTYANYFSGHEAKKYRMEASPRYIFGGRKLAKTIHDMLGPVRVVFLVRDPVERLISYFKHMSSTSELPAGMSADDYACRGLEALSGALDAAEGRPIDVYSVNVYVRGIAQGFYADYLEEWEEVFPTSIQVHFFEDLRNNPERVVRDLCRWLDLNPSIYDSAEFTHENRSVSHKNAFFFAVAGFINDHGEAFWRKHPDLKQTVRDIYFRVNEKHSVETGVSAAVRRDLDAVYRSYNVRLAAMLKQRPYQDFPAWISSGIAGMTGAGEKTPAAV